MPGKMDEIAGIDVLKETETPAIFPHLTDIRKVLRLILRK